MDDFDETSGSELNAGEEALLEEMPSLEDVGVSRRTFLERADHTGQAALSEHHTVA